MKTRLTAIAVLFSTLLIAGAASAADMAEMSLRGGRTGMVEIVGTTYDSVSIKFSKGEVEGSATLRAEELDPNSFYNIRKDRMEDTAENHARLAIFCAMNGLFSRAKHQRELAEAIDPEFVKDVKEKYGEKILNGIAEKLMKSAEKLYHEGDLDTAKDYASRVMTRLPDSDYAIHAKTLLGMIDGDQAEKQAAAKQERAAKLDDQTKAAHEKVLKELAPLQKRLDYAKKLSSAALQQSNQGQAKKAYQSAGAECATLVRECEAAIKKAGDDQQMVDLIQELMAEAKSEGVSAYVNAGGVDVARSSFSEAEKSARKALAIDPDSSKAQSFLKEVQVGASSSDWVWGRGGRRGGGGRRR